MTHDKHFGTVLTEGIRTMTFYTEVIVIHEPLKTNFNYPCEYELRPSSRRHLSIFIRGGIHTLFAHNGKETVSIAVQSHLQVHR